ncbi:MAG: FliH/SctL family protein [Gammaproteobacteria bacterium]|nr:FliH/SctL family protein [Gammaproteobacteria bacterium]
MTDVKTRSKVISGESGETAYQRWELPHLLTANRIEQIQKQAYDEGFARGQADGLKATQQAMQARAAQFDAILAALADPLKELDERMTEELVALVISVARVFVRRELHLDPGQVVATVREALAVLPANARQVRVRLHPEDARLVRERMPPGEEQAWKIIDDPTLTRGGCRVDTETSQIDATLDARLTEIAATILGGERSRDAA